MTLRIGSDVKIRSSGSGIRSTTKKPSRSSGAKARPRKPAPSKRSKSDTFFAGIEALNATAQLAEMTVGVVGMIAESRERAKAADENIRAGELLVNLHREDFAGLLKPEPPELQQVSRNWKKMWRNDCDALAANEALFAEQQADYELSLAQWRKIRDHDPLEVIAAVDEVLADNASQSACIDAGVAPSGNYVTLVVHYPGSKIAEGLVRGGITGKGSRPRNKAEQIQFYRDAVASTIVATAKEALAYAPAAKEAYVVVLRYDLQGWRNNSAMQLDAIYCGAINRTVLTLNWDRHIPFDVVRSARDAQINQDRKGRLLPLGKTANPNLRQLITQIIDAHTHKPHRYSHSESVEFMKQQAPEPFAAACACPGCQWFDTHEVQERRAFAPQWAQSLRRCSSCNLQWAQT